MMEQNVFFIDKDDAIEFQNRCVIAIFLDTHPHIRFVKYIDINIFWGIIDDIETVIYLFDTPKTGSQVGCVFRSRNRRVSKPIHQYMLFSKRFLDEYTEYRDNVYEYIMGHFFSCWKKYFGGLFISKEPEREMSFKYKKCVVEGKDDREYTAQLGLYFKDFLDGSLVFSNPKTFNDPFDCDCDLPDLNSKINLLWNAFNSLKYSGRGSTSVKKEDVENILIEEEQVDNEKDNIKNIICRIIEMGKKDDRTDKSKLTTPETIEAIEEFYRRMLYQVHNLKERFRVFCTGDKPDDILMWGYYCDGGNGVCCKYDRRDIVNSILSERSDCICVYGNVDYQDNKPQYNYITDDLADNVFEYVMRCVFTKYSGWKHENEFRYVLMERMFNCDYIAVNSPVQEYYLGCKMDSDSMLLTKNYLVSKGVSIKVLEKSPDMYKLILS